MSEFVLRFDYPPETINTKYNSESLKRIQENQKVIEALLKVFMLRGKQGFLVRGHRDDKVDWTEKEEQAAENQDNFVDIVRFRAETDDALKRHLERGPTNAGYTSKTIQNELITVIGKHSESEIVTDIQKAKFFSIIADEVADCANTEQCSICTRYVLNNDVNETFISFVKVEEIT